MVWVGAAAHPGHRPLFHTFFNIPICASSIKALAISLS